MKSPIASAIVGFAALVAACSEPVGSKRESTDRPAAPETDQSDASGEPTSPPPPSPIIASSQPAADFESHDGDLDWLDLLKPEDRAAVDSMSKVWTQAISEARAAGYGADMENLGAVTDPYAGFRTLVLPAPGVYACRSVHLGSDRGLLAFVSYPAFDCRISRNSDGRPLLTKATGSARTQGLLYPLEDGRMLFLGGQAFGDDERRFPRYGEEYSRDDFGVLEQIGDGHWRIVKPGPRQHQRLELLEIWTLPEL